MSDDGPQKAPFEQAIDVINRLLDLCAAHGLERKAKAIAAGVKLPEPQKRGPGAPKKRSKDYSILLAVLLAIRTSGKPNKRGAKSALAAEIAKNELIIDGGRRRISKGALANRKRTLENFISQIPPQYQLLATFCERRALKGEAIEVTQQTVAKLIQGDEGALAVFSNEVGGFADLLIKYKRLHDKVEPHDN